MLCIRWRRLIESLDQIRPNNSQSEYYLTDCPRVLKESGENVVALNTFHLIEAMGINTREQMADVTRTIHARPCRIGW